MTPVHVLVSANPSTEQAWREAFQGAVDVYRFTTIAETLERLTSAQSPIDLLVIADVADDPFGPTADQLVHRLECAPLVSSSMLRSMGIAVVGHDLQSDYSARVRTITNLGAALRLVKFGEVESPRGARDLSTAQSSVSAEAPGSSMTPIDVAPTGGSGLASSIISSIWDAPEPQADPSPAQAAPAQTHRIEPAREPVQQPAAGRRVQMPRGSGRLRAGGPAAAEQRHGQRGAAGGLFAAAPHVAPVAAEHEQHGGHVEYQQSVHSGHDQHGGQPQYYEPGTPLPPELGGLHPSQLVPQGVDGGFRGNVGRGGHVAASSHHAHAAMPQPDARPQPRAAQPHPSMPHAASVVPPQLGQQVQHMLYPSAAPADPVLGFSSSVQRALAGAQQPMPMPPNQHAQQPGQYHPQQPVQHHPHHAHGASGPGMVGRMVQRVAAGERTVPMPNMQPAQAGYPAVMQQQHPAQAHHPQAYPAQGLQVSAGYQASPDLLARAESGASASFG